MTHAAFKMITCECGQNLIVCQPEVKVCFESVVSDNCSLLVLDGSAASCPACGLVYMLPPAETFDLERQAPFARMLALLDALEAGEEGPGENPANTDYDIPF